jgi:hypothetical protein
MSISALVPVDSTRVALEHARRFPAGQVLLEDGAAGE